MRTETKLFCGLGLFMLPLGIVYWFTSYERAGSLLLIVVAVSFLFIGSYLGLQAKRMDGSRPEDYDALPGEGSGPVGSFPVGSIWPFTGAIAAMMMAYGGVFNSFLCLPAGGLILITVIGMARESYVSELGHEVLDSHAQSGQEPERTFSDNVAK